MNLNKKKDTKRKKQVLIEYLQNIINVSTILFQCRTAGFNMQNIAAIFHTYFIILQPYCTLHSTENKVQNIYIYGKHMNIYVLNIKQYLFHTNNIAKRRVSICNILQQYVIHIDHICLICSPCLLYTSPSPRD